MPPFTDVDIPVLVKKGHGGVFIQGKGRLGEHKVQESHDLLVFFDFRKVACCLGA